ncbi:MAG: hypothetical protein AABW50_01765 [Nanoarchaeota archaeon]
MEGFAKRRLMLGVIASKVNSNTGWKKFLHYLSGIYVGGVLRGKYQKDFSDKVGWSTAKLTFLNAVIFGGLATLEYFFLRTNGSFILKSFTNVLSFGHDTSLVILRDYAYFNVAQSLVRVFGAVFFKFGMMSLSLEGILVNIVYPRFRKARKDFSGRFFR